MLYTGDVVWIAKRQHGKLKDLDLVIPDGSFIRAGSNSERQKTRQIHGYNDVPNLVKLFSQFTEHIIFTHFGNWFYRDLKKSRQKIASLGNSVKVEVAYDGVLINI